jgi:hyperosmotically inducible periplasmic protein
MQTRWQPFQAWGVVVLVGLMLVGCAAMTGRQSPGEAVSDSAITTKVTTNLVADSMVGALDIDVDTNNGVVILTGFVPSEQERQRAIQIAQSVDGVKRVDARNLVVRR